MNSQSNSGSQMSMPAAGVGMVEVLVTLFILSIGLLGVASLQFIGSFTNADALNRSQAVMVAQQMSERLKASSVISVSGDGRVVDNNYFDSGIYNFDNLSCSGGQSDWTCHCLSLPAAIPNCQVANCSGADFAVYDAYESSCAVISTNPAAQLDLSCTDRDVTDGNTCSAGSRHRIRITWPVEDWQNFDRQLNSECNDDGVSEAMDCVILDVFL